MNKINIYSQCLVTAARFLQDMNNMFKIQQWKQNESGSGSGTVWGNERHQMNNVIMRWRPHKVLFAILFCLTGPRQTPHKIKKLQCRKSQTIFMLIPDKNVVCLQRMICILHICETVCYSLSPTFCCCCCFILNIV